ncbi:MAG: hypothetical protein H6610_12060, partial [Ignavibacteriales bacterium]|nr:hypothetical protein [Ignavibacteriales bacterium]
MWIDTNFSCIQSQSLLVLVVARRHCLHASVLSSSDLRIPATVSYSVTLSAIASGGKRMDETQYHNITEKLKNSQIIGDTLTQFLKVKGESSFTNRGLAMLMMSDDNLPTFELDKNFKNTGWFNNHPFADFLVPVEKIIENPIIFWVTSSLDEGCNYIFNEEPIYHHIIKIGRSYFIEDILIELFKALKNEKITIIDPWFFNYIPKTVNKNIYDISEDSKSVIDEIEPQVRNNLSNVNLAKINFLIFNLERAPGLEVICKILKINNYITGSVGGRNEIIFKDTISQKFIDLTFEKFINEELINLKNWIIIKIEFSSEVKHWTPLIEKI